MIGDRSSTVNPFDPAAIDPETAAFNAALEERAAAASPPHSISVQARRAAWEAGTVGQTPLFHSALAQDRVIAGVPCRLLVPETVKGVYVHIHGGGWTLGRAGRWDVHNEPVARNAHVVVVSFAAARTAARYLQP